MTKIIMIHSFRRGVGRSSIIANLAVLMAAKGRCVGVIDTNFQSPGQHVLFGLADEKITFLLNDYLKDECAILQTLYNVTPEGLSGRVLMVPASPDPAEIARILRTGYHAESLNTELQDLADLSGMDVMLIDCPAGLNSEALSSIAISNMLILLMRTDQQDHQGTAIMLDVVRTLNIPDVKLIVNEVPAVYYRDEVKQDIETTYACDVITLLPHTAEMMSLSSSIFVLQFPGHRLTALLKDVADTLLDSPDLSVYLR